VSTRFAAGRVGAFTGVSPLPALLLQLRGREPGVDLMPRAWARGRESAHASQINRLIILFCFYFAATRGGTSAESLERAVRRVRAAKIARVAATGRSNRPQRSELQ